MEDIVSTYNEARECDYKDRHYSVRDNGAIYRHQKEGCRASKLDNTWSFGTKDAKTGYMLYGGIRVHQVVATAFHGVPDDPNMVVDHIDTNRCNNRPENLRWLTRLENVLHNPFTRKRLEFLCGSIEAFLKNPAILRQSSAEPNTVWMRTVSKEEAAKCLRNLTRWAEEDKKLENTKPSGNGIGEWIYQDGDKKSDGFGEPWDKDWDHQEYRTPWQIQKEQIERETQAYFETQLALKPSLTPGAMQREWKIPTEFPLCPQKPSSSPLQDYLANLKPGEIYCHNDVYESPILKAELSVDGQKIVVLCTTSGATNFALSEITFEDGQYVHTSVRTFFSEEGAEKYYTISLGKEWAGGDVFEDFC